MTPMPTILEIQRAVSKVHRVRVSTLRAPDGLGSRKRRKAWARQVAMCLSTRLTEHSLSRIGQFFGGRDHTTVIHACRAVEGRCRRDRRLRNRMRRMTLELLRRGA